VASDRSRTSEADEPRRDLGTEPEPQLTNEQWFLIEDLFRNPEPSPKGGRPPALPRPCVEGILWVLRTGARWKDLPKSFPSSCTCWRRHRAWTETGIWQAAWARLLRALDRKGKLDFEETTADGTFSSAKKGVTRSARPSAAREPKSWSTVKDTESPWPRRSKAHVPTR
jgi:transposase